MRSLPYCFLAFTSTCMAVTAAQLDEQKPSTSVDKWTGKTIVLIGAHADDDALSHGTLAMLQSHGNEV